MEDLIKKYEIHAEVLLKLLQDKDNTEEEIKIYDASRRLVVGFIYDLKALENNTKHLSINIDRSGNWDYFY